MTYDIVFLMSIFVFIGMSAKNNRTDFRFSDEKLLYEETKKVLLKKPFFISSEKDNLKLAVYDFVDEKNSNKEIIIFIPGAGFYGNSLYQKMALELKSHNKNCILFDLRGHGYSEGERGDVPTVDHIMTDIQTVIMYVKNKYPDHKIILAGHSSGAAVCLNYSKTKYKQPDQYLLIAPYLGSSSGVIKKTSFIKKIRWYMYIINSIISFDFLKKIKTVFFNYDNKTKEKNPLLVDAYSYTMSLVTEIEDISVLKNIKIPTVLLLAENDELFDSSKIFDITRQSNNANIITKIIKNSSHLTILLKMYLDSDRDERIVTDTINCTFFNPLIKKSEIPVLCLGGSEGGVPEWWAKLIYDKGFIVCALGYFACEKRPKNLEHIDLSYFEDAIRFITKKYNCQKVIVIGMSRGGELALLLGSLYPDLFEKIIALVPSCQVNGGFPNPNRPAWVLKDHLIPFMGGLSSSAEITEKEDAAYAIESQLIPYHEGSENDPYVIADLFRKRLEMSQNVLEKSSIQVENITGTLLLFSGDADAIWPSTYYGNRIMQRLDEKKSKIEREHVVCFNVGHGVLATVAVDSKKEIPLLIFGDDSFLNVRKLLPKVTPPEMVTAIILDK